MESNPLEQIAQACGGDLTVHQLKDEHGEVVHSFATMSMPLRKDHWIYQKALDGFGHPPPMPLRIGAEEVAIITMTAGPSANPAGWGSGKTITVDREELADMIRMAGRYAVRSATMHGAEMDFDPDALLQNLVVGFLGYWTQDGLSGDSFDNPTEPFVPQKRRPRYPGGTIDNYPNGENCAATNPPASPPAQP